MNTSVETHSKLSIRHHLIGLVIIAIVPVVFFASGLVAYLADQRAETLESNLLGTTRALNAALDEQMVSVVSSLKILAEIEDFNPDSIQYLHKRLRRFVDHQKDWSYISFVDTQGVQIFNTSKGFGSKLQRFKKEPFFKEMLKSGKTVFSGYRANEKVVIAAVPVKKNGIILYALVGAIDLESFGHLLRSQNLPKGWTASIMDLEGNYLAHSRNAVNVGKKAPAKLAEKILWEGAHVFNDENKKGGKSFGGTVHSRMTGWTLVLRVPDDGHLFTYWKSISFIVMGGVLFLILSILFALYMGRKIINPILALSQAAKDLGMGNPLKEMETTLQEVHDVNHALKLASLQRGQNEVEIRNLYVRAQEAVELRDTFLSVASHELKTPITTLKLQFQMLDRLIRKKESIPRQDLEKPFSRIQDQVRRLVLLIDDLLDVSRISAGKIEYHPETFDLVPFVQDVVQQFEGEGLKAGSPITVAGEDELIGHWDRHRLEQVMVNLITNAIKYGNSRPISITVSKTVDEAIIEVKDQGMGISNENLGRIFERFERAVDSRSISGLGLGLWIVKRILEGLGGSISVTSQLDMGSTFKVSLPMELEALELDHLAQMVNLDSRSVDLH